MKSKLLDPGLPEAHQPSAAGHSRTTEEHPAASLRLPKSKLKPHPLEVLFKHRFIGVSYDKT